MKKSFKKVLCLFMAIMLMFSFAVNSFAEEGEAAPEPEAKVARIHVIVYMKTTNVTGHVWLYFENLSSETQKVGYYDLPAGQGVSVGIINRKQGGRIYYNVESFAANYYNQSGWYSISRDLNKAELQKATDSLKTYKNAWDPIFNCMDFAFTVWNDTTGDGLGNLVFPIFGLIQLWFRGAKRGLKFYYPQPDQVYAQLGMGFLGTLVRATKGTIYEKL